MSADKGSPSPGDGLRSLRTTGVFRAVNFELYAKPVGITSVVLIACLLQEWHNSKFYCFELFTSSKSPEIIV